MNSIYNFSRKLTDAQRFWVKVDIKNPETCWLWKGSKSANGYGSFSTTHDHAVRIIQSHRFSYELIKGKIPDGLLVLHKCDTPLCVNPRHLFLGTQKDNMIDRAIKGRCQKLNNYNKINENQKNEIINKYKPNKYGFSKLAKEYGVSCSTIRKILKIGIYKKAS